MSSDCKQQAKQTKCCLHRCNTHDRLRTHRWYHLASGTALPLNSRSNCGLLKPLSPYCSTSCATPTPCLTAAASDSATALRLQSGHTHSSCSDTLVGKDATQLRFGLGAVPSRSCGIFVQVPVGPNCQPVNQQHIHHGKTIHQPNNIVAGLHARTQRRNERLDAFERHYYRCHLAQAANLLCLRDT
eukprot:GHRR01031695.1.p1 GENE.GHRR01031695.1~~GHRR01031695.1.p1  ORF type:complete len:186 (+),score=32.01 GHRR01031695.1:256-813(+)